MATLNDFELLRHEEELLVNEIEQLTAILSSYKANLVNVRIRLKEFENESNETLITMTN